MSAAAFWRWLVSENERLQSLGTTEILEAVYGRLMSVDERLALEVSEPDESQAYVR